MAEIEQEISRAEAMLADWNVMATDTAMTGVLQIGKTLYRCAGVAYEAGDVRVIHIMAVSPRRALVESATVLLKEPTAVLIDRILLAEPLCYVGRTASTPLLCDDMAIKRELYQSTKDRYLDVVVRALEEIMKFGKEEPNLLKMRASSARGRGESVGAFQGGLPSLGKRR